MKPRIRFRLHVHLVLFGLICFIPAFTAVGWIGLSLARQEQRRVEEQARNVAGDFVQDIDSEIGAASRALAALASSPELDTGDFRTFQNQALTVARDNGSVGVGLRSLTGQHIVNTLLPFGTHPMPTTSASELLDTDRKAIAEKKMVISDLYRGATDGRSFVTVVYPVMRDGAVKYLLTLVFTPARIVEQLRLGSLAEEGWLSAVVGSDHRVIARTRELDRFLGNPATGDLVTAIRARDRGALRSVTLDGVSVYSAFQRSAYGWTVVVSVPTGVLDAPVWRLLVYLLIVLALVLAATLLGAWGYGQLLGRELSELAENARRMGQKVPLAPFEGMVTEVIAAQQALADANETADQLLRELDHRVKNTLSVVQSLASRTVSKPEERSAMAGRIAALSSAHEALSEGRWSSVHLPEVIQKTCRMQNVPAKLEGPDIFLTPRATTCLAQVFHELASNAVRHAGIHVGRGRVDIRWQVEGGKLLLDWREQGGDARPRAEPKFGLRLVELCVVRQLDGKLAIEPDETGWHIRMTIPLRSQLGLTGRLVGDVDDDA
jgi:two-component sensor histidine kinase